MGKRQSQSPLLGEHPFKSKTFSRLEEVCASFKTSDFKEKNEHDKADFVNSALVKLVHETPEPCFLLDAVVDFIGKVEEEKVLENHSFSSFELWLNQFSTLSPEENYKIRGKIVGKCLPRDAYQTYFPIGMGKSYPGTHFVTAHNSPDLDTTVASFWGWVDAFAARISDGLHIWNVPGGPPVTQVEIGLLFKDLFGAKIFDCLAKTRLSLTLTSTDLLSQKGMLRKHTNDKALRFDHERQRNAVVLIDEKGYYLGDWRTIDLEGIRQVVMSFNNCLMWFESNLHIQLISCFAEKKLTIEHISKEIRSLLEMKICECAPAKELPPKLLQFVNDYLVKVLGVEKGNDATFEEFALELEKIDIVNFTQIISWLRSLLKSELFDADGVITENRPLIFNQLEILVKLLSEAFNKIRDYVDSLAIAFKIKTEVFGFKPQYLSNRTDIEEIRSKMGNYSYLTVNQMDENGRPIPIGVIHSHELSSETLGTVSLRDFCNREEMKIPPYLQVISVIDHHKDSLITDTPPKAMVSDAQSSNALVAELAFSINDQYGVCGFSKEDVEVQLKSAEKDLDNPQGIRIYQRLLQKKKVLQRGSHHYVDSNRELVEYLHFVYAILDDTDLLTKVSCVDVNCMASLLNRMKTLITKKEIEIVNFDDLLEDEQFTKKAAERLLQNQDFYSLYSKVYEHKEQGVNENLKKALKH
ncbi:MAG: hypothetical protein HRU43_02565, partial [Simkaniaceae bacterium]|nr:hypothetical protein [Simkaniaceae bacterium]